MSIAAQIDQVLNPPVTDRPAAPAARLAGRLGVGAAAIGVMVLIGWLYDIEAAKALIPGLIVTIPNTAVGFILGGSALWLQRSEAATVRTALLAQLLGGLVLTLGVLTFLERVVGLDFGIDLLLFPQQVSAYPYLPPGRMATNSTVSFIIAGAGLLLLGREPRVTPYVREALAAAGLLIAVLALLGYLFGASGLYAFDPHTGMALLTAVSFLVLQTGILLARPDRGLAGLLTGHDMAGHVVRRMLAAAVLVPLVLGWLWLRGRDVGVFSRESGMALLSLLTMLALVTVVIQSGRVLRRTDRQREALLARERDLRALADTARQNAEYARAEAEAAARTRSDFLATMSHELRTPLNAIIGYAGLMHEGIGGRLADAHQQQVDRIRMAAQHLLSLIDQVLSLSRLEANRETLDLQTVDMVRLVHDCAALMEPLLAQRSLSFVIETAAANGATIRTDPDRVRQIVLNLLTNAAKFTERGSVTLRLEPGEGRTLRVVVEDTGIGIAEEHQERIFDAFWQVDMNATRRHGGAGLGLALSRDLARLLDGELTVQSAPGAGSRFALTLPTD